MENSTLRPTIAAKIITHTQLLLLGNFAITHTSHCRGINLCNTCVSLVSVCLASILSQKGKLLRNHNARGINIQLHAHQLHNKNCWGINCVIIPAPMLVSIVFHILDLGAGRPRNSFLTPFATWVGLKGQRTPLGGPKDHEFRVRVRAGPARPSERGSYQKGAFI